MALTSAQKHRRIQKLRKKQKGKCIWCQKDFPRHKLTLEHLIPRSKGGTDAWYNLAAACSPCNNKRGDNV